MRRLCYQDAGFDADVDRLAARVPTLDPGVTAQVTQILERVQREGDTALFEYTHQFDGLELSAASVEVPRARLVRALEALDPALREALQAAADRIRRYHEQQRLTDWQIDDGAGGELGQRVTALDRVGLYVPGGRAAYPSTVLMNAIPAQVAGVGELIMTVPAPQGELSETVLAAAALCAVDRVFTVGGAQAIAALAFGTDSIPAVDKIVGPGNRYVATAKRLVFGVVGIDMVAGPSEIVVVMDDSARPEQVALDLFAQAEHDEAARAIAVTWDDAVLDAVASQIDRLLPRMGRRAVIETALRESGALIRTADAAQAAAVVNRLAPEHLQLAVADPEPLLAGIRHAGALFVGHHSAEVFGDYCAGPNHVLPTGRTARFSSPLGVYDFQKRSSLIRCSARGAGELAAIAARLASSEGLDAHAASARARIESVPGESGHR